MSLQKPGIYPLTVSPYQKIELKFMGWLIFENKKVIGQPIQQLKNQFWELFFHRGPHFHLFLFELSSKQRNLAFFGHFNAFSICVISEIYFKFLRLLTRNECLSKKTLDSEKKVSRRATKINLRAGPYFGHIWPVVFYLHSMKRMSGHNIESFEEIAAKRN